MTSRISFFNKGVARNYLRRFWPLWTTYLVILLLMLPVAVATWIRGTAAWSSDTPDLAVYRSGIMAAWLSAFAGIAAAMAMFHYLYQNRSCGMMNTLPIRRETMFGTAWLTGVVPLLAADVLTAAVTALIFATRGAVTMAAIGKWLLLVVFSNLAFYGFAVFCAMLTGSLLVLPLVYGVLSLTAVVAEGCARGILSNIVYGMGTGELKLKFLSPPAKLFSALNVENVYDKSEQVWKVVKGAYELHGLGCAAIYAAVGLLLSYAALRLYRRRRMETATDVVAIPILKPVFKYCLSVGCALVFCYLIFGLFFGGSLLFPSSGAGFSGRVNALIVLLLLLLGAFIGCRARRCRRRLEER